MRECPVIMEWRKTEFLLPRSGVKVLGLWPEGDTHLCQRAYSDDRWYDGDGDYDLTAPEWWLIPVLPKEEA